MSLTDRIRDQVESLLKQYYFKEDSLDAFLARYENSRELYGALHSWMRSKEMRHTWLTEAVTSQSCEIIAILLYYGADPQQRCPGRENQNAFDGGFLHYLPRYTTIFYFIMTLLNNGLVEGDNIHGYVRPNAHLIGLNPNAPLPDCSREGAEFIPPNWDTALTYAVQNKLPFCVRWLILGRGADVRVKNGEGFAPLEVALRCFPKRPAAPYDGLMYQERWENDLRLWRQIISALVLFGKPDIEAEKWRLIYREAYAFFTDLVLSSL
jgi:hypothetical protein